MTIFWPLKSPLIYLTLGRRWILFLSRLRSFKQRIGKPEFCCLHASRKENQLLHLFCSALFGYYYFLKKKVEVALALLSHSASLKIDLSFHCLHTIKTQLISIELWLSALLLSSFFYYPAPKLMNILEYLPNFALIELNCLRLVFVEERKRSAVKKSNRCQWRLYE